MTKTIKILSVIILFSTSCSSQKAVLKRNKDLSMDFTNITYLITLEEFEKTKEFILEKGDKMTYRNYDNNNPHYKFPDFDVFLGADIGQRNINNDPKISNFNQLTISDWNSDIRYYELIIVRKGDIKTKKARIKKGMNEERVYLVDVYGKGLELMEKKLSNYLKQIKTEITAANKLYTK
ncbi:MAG: hypothetical protein HON19_00270 [Flavobacteriales bacterium]|jgi:signal peptidase I|nr:hypothetical protein [Flavobacteriales bacterium]